MNIIKNLRHAEFISVSLPYVKLSLKPRGILKRVQDDVLKELR